MKPTNDTSLTRREVIKVTASAALAASASSAGSSLFATNEARPSLISQENSRDGSLDWQLTRVRVNEAQTGRMGTRAQYIEGYCSRQSVEAGESLDIMVSTNPASRFIIEIFRTGYYGGRGARLMKTLGPLQGATQPMPKMGPKRLHECAWEPSATIQIPDDWPSGVYLGRLTTVPDSAREPYWQSYVVFIVRDTRRADILLQCSDNTWQAYNPWPGGYSLYSDPRGTHARDISVSFDRPYSKYSQIYDNPQSIGSGEWLCFEFPLAYWLEKQGYDVTYCSNSDCLDAAQITRCKSFLSVGHDEYWDLPQYAAVKRAIESGVSVLWLSANSVFAVSAFSPSSRGVPNRIITRAGHFGGMTDDDVEKIKKSLISLEEFNRIGPDESLIIGARSMVPYNGGGDWSCAKPDHWIFEGTGMKKGDAIPGLVGYEHHGVPAQIPGLEVIGEGTAWPNGSKTAPAHWTATIYPGPKNNIVFNAATIFWVQGLSSPPGHMLPWSHWNRPHGPDERVQRITANLLQRALA